jgi:hypothetical protein
MMMMMVVVMVMVMMMMITRAWWEPERVWEFSKNNSSFPVI